MLKAALIVHLCSAVSGQTVSGLPSSPFAGGPHEVCSYRYLRHVSLHRSAHLSSEACRLAVARSLIFQPLAARSHQRWPSSRAMCSPATVTGQRRASTSRAIWNLRALERPTSRAFAHLLADTEQE